MGQILRDLNDSTGFAVVAIGADAEEVHAQGQVDIAHEVSGKHEASFEHAHEHEPPVAIFTGDFGAQLTHSGGNGSAEIRTDGR